MKISRRLSPPLRRVAFLGDLTDRGPKNVLAVQIARSMVEAGTAVIDTTRDRFDAVPGHNDTPPPSRSR